jgi:hypothetical protein
VQDLKQDRRIASTDEGIQIEVSDEQPSKADSPRVKRAQSRSNVNSDSCAQDLKQELEIAVTDDGIQID